MKKLFIALAAAFLSADLYAAEKLDFSFDSFSGALAAAPAAAQPEMPAVSAPAKAKAGRYVQVSAYVNLNGNGWMPGNDGGYTTVYLTGWATFRDATGQVTSNSTYLNVPVSLWVKPNQYVTQMVMPNTSVQFNYKGKPAGSAFMNGSINVSGWPSSSYFSLSGSGYLSGSVYVADME